MRRLHARLRLTGTLVAEAPLHVGGEGVDPDSDMPLARDGQGRLYLPGTSLTGAIRAALPERPATVEATFWGATRRAPSADHASLVWVMDGLVTTDHAPEIRDGVGIDRVSGTAKEEIKFERPVLPPGTRIEFDMTVELPAESDKPAAIALLADLVAAADPSRGWLAIGAAQTRGLGRVSLTDWQVRCQRLDTADAILDLVRHGPRHGGDDLTAAVRTQAATAVTPCRWQLKIAWAAASPMMVKAAGEGERIKMLPLTTRDRHGAGRRLVLPGSGIKGALRSHAERIERTLRGNDALADKKLHEQLDTAPLAVELFGSSGPRRRQERAAAGGWRRGRGAVTAADCVATETVTALQIEKLATEEPVEWLAASGPDATDAPSGLDIAYHNAVDRWAGGAADAFLFAAVEPRLQWEPIVLTLDLARLPPGRAAPLSLLMMVLRDLGEGWLTLGFGGNRGYGEIEVSRIEISGADPSDDTAPPLSLTWDRGSGWTGAGATFAAWLEEGWRAWRANPPEADA